MLCEAIHCRCRNDTEIVGRLQERSKHFPYKNIRLFQKLLCSGHLLRYHLDGLLFHLVGQSIQCLIVSITVNAICPGYTKTSIFGDAPASTMDFFASDCPAKRMGDPKECAALALFLASGLARYITGAAIPVDGALSAGHQSISSWKHPEILTDGKLNSKSTIAALMENDTARAVVEQYLPGFAQNQQAKVAYGMTFGQIGPMMGLPETALKALLEALDNL